MVSTRFNRFADIIDLDRYADEYYTAPVLVDELSRAQIDWLNAFHKNVYETLAPRLTDEEKTWLANKCAPIGR